MDGEGEQAEFACWNEQADRAVRLVDESLVGMYHAPIRGSHRLADIVEIKRERLQEILDRLPVS